MPIMTPVMAASLIILAGTGIAMALMLNPGSLGTLATIAVAIVGFGMLTPTGIRMDKLGRSIQGVHPLLRKGSNCSGFPIGWKL
ncbi:MAG: hypothetical protein Q8O55_12470 [Dehalococcoidales bacterium]|nr:hypothetical protein [Dehalococcoidales bacterium]